MSTPGLAADGLNGVEMQSSTFPKLYPEDWQNSWSFPDDSCGQTVRDGIIQCVMSRVSLHGLVKHVPVVILMNDLGKATFLRAEVTLEDLALRDSLW